METGDFDDTPAPSARPSKAALREDSRQTQQPNIEAERVSGPFLNILKTSTSGPMLFSRDGPSSPAASQAPPGRIPEPTGRPKQQYDDKITSAVQSPALSSPVSPDKMESNRGTSPPIPASDRICLDPALHQEQTHAHVHHLGLLRGADFCDWGEPIKDSEIHELSAIGSPESEDYSMRSGEVHRIQPDGSIVVEGVLVPIERTPGHTRALKVRPAFNYDAATANGMLRGEIQVRHDPKKNKVWPVDRAMEAALGEAVRLPIQRPSTTGKDATQDLSSPTDIPISKTRSDVGSDIRILGEEGQKTKLLQDGEHVFRATGDSEGEQSLRIPIAKIRPVGGDSEDSQRATLHQHHLVPTKVRPTPMEELNNASPVTYYPQSIAGSLQFMQPYSLQDIRSFLVPDNTEYQLRLDQIAQGPVEERSQSEARGTLKIFAVPTSKVRPFLASSDTLEESRKPNSHGSKVRPFADFMLNNDHAEDNLLAMDTKALSPLRKPLDHSLIDDNSTDAEVRTQSHSLSKDVRLPTLDAAYGHATEADPQFPISSGLQTPQLKHDEGFIGDTFPEEHSISGCADFPDLNNSRRHSMGSCEKTPVRSPFDPHQSSQCSEYDVYGGPEMHLVQSDVQSPLGVANHHKGSQCGIHLVRADLAQHTLSVDAGLSAAAVSNAQHDLGICTLYPSKILPPSFDTMASGKYQDLREAHGNIQRGRSSQNPGRSHSDTAGLDYRKTIEWLRELLGYPEAQSPELTRLPSRRKTFDEPPQENRQIPDSLIPKAQNARNSTRKSSHSGSLNSRIDGPGFQRVVDDLEALLNEAVALASQVVHQPDTSATEAKNELPVQAIEHEEGDPRRSRTPVTVKDQAETDCINVAQASRPKVPHAATFSAGPRRPRLQDIVKKYSGNDENLMTTTSVAPLRRATAPRKYAEEVRISIPQRKSSRPSLKPCAPPKVLRKKQSRIHYRDHPRVDHLPCDEKEMVDFDADENKPARLPVKRSALSQHVPYRSVVEGAPPETDVAGRQMPHEHGISLRHRSHVSLPGAQDFSLPRSRKRQPIARDWSSLRKKIVASTACLSTALVGVLLGIYAGLVPRIQYYIVDESHATIYGNTGCFLGLAIPTFCFWPLPLLHGRKPYILSGLVLAMPLLFPQALSVLNQRLTHTGA